MQNYLYRIKATTYFNGEDAQYQNLKGSPCVKVDVQKLHLPVLELQKFCLISFKECI